MKMSKIMFHTQQSNLLTYCVQLLLASTIVTKSINCFVLENTEWSRGIADAKSDNATTTTIDDSNGDVSTDFLPIDDDNNNADDEYSTLANDATSLDDIETGKY